LSFLTFYELIKSFNELIKFFVKNIKKYLNKLKILRIIERNKEVMKI